MQVHPTGCSGAGRTLLICPKLGQRGQAFMSPLCLHTDQSSAGYLGKGRGLPWEGVWRGGSLQKGYDLPWEGPLACFGKGRGPWLLTPGPGSSVKRPQLKAVLQQPPPSVRGSSSFPAIPSPSPSQPPPSTPSPVSGAASPGPSGHCAVPLRWHGCPWMRHIPAYLPPPPCDNALPRDHALGAPHLACCFFGTYE